MKIEGKPQGAKFSDVHLKRPSIDRAAEEKADETIYPEVKLKVRPAIDHNLGTEIPYERSKSSIDIKVINTF